MKINIYFIVICAMLLLQGCTALGLAKVLMPEKKSGTSVNANAQVKREHTASSRSARQHQDRR